MRKFACPWRPRDAVASGQHLQAMCQNGPVRA